VFHIIATIAFPLIYSVYLGVAESARDIAIDIAKRKLQPDLSLAGRMDTELRAAQLAHRWMLDAAARNAPSADTVNEVMIGRVLVARHAIAAVELALELAGRASFYRATGLERRLRDIQAARFHPLQSRTTGALRGSDSARLADIQRVLTCVPGWIVLAETIPGLPSTRRCGTHLEIISRPQRDGGAQFCPLRRAGEKTTPHSVV
jgi:hypothetical protein